MMWPFKKRSTLPQPAHIAATESMTSIGKLQLLYLLNGDVDGAVEASEQLVRLGASKDSSVRQAQGVALVMRLKSAAASETAMPVWVGAGVCPTCEARHVFSPDQRGPDAVPCQKCKASVQVEWWKVPPIA
jgi:hypothetical protein